MRLQHEGFGSDIRALDPETRGIVASEIDSLRAIKESGGMHPHERRLQGELRDVGYLRLYKKGNSLRVYFTLQGHCLYMVAILDKRRNDLTAGEKEMLKNRLEDIIRHVGGET